MTMKLNRNKLLKKVVGSVEDFEWYPTSDLIIESIRLDLEKEYYRKSISFLDCGAGDGKVIEKLLCKDEEDSSGKIYQGYAIEKSKTLIEALDKDIFLIGTDFMQQTLIDKSIDVIFSNPPYSEYDLWAEKIIKEGNASYVYLVLPERWVKNERIQQALESRDAEFKIIYNFDFRYGADRKARVKVNVLKINLSYKNGHSKVDPFTLWFNTNFKNELMSKESVADYERDKIKKESRQEKLKKALSVGGSLIDKMEEFYLEELQSLISMYQSVMALDTEILRELNVNQNSLEAGIKQRIEGLKINYWSELFDRLDTVTNRLTTKSRKNLLSTLQKNTSVDFSASNAYSIVLWVVKQSNNYFDKQLIEMFESLFSLDHVIKYKSNDKVFNKEDWRWNKGDPKDASHYTLDYRIVHVGHAAINTTPYTYDMVNGLNKTAASFLDDIMTVGNNLGYKIEHKAHCFDWESGKKNEFMCINPKTGLLQIFVAVRAYKNGNIHLKFNQSFMKAFNVEFGRLKGWLRNKQEASEETGYPIKDIDTMFKINFSLENNSMLLLSKLE